MRWFEAACVVIVIATLVAMARRTAKAQLASDYALLAVAAWIGEESCVAIYRHYEYAASWDLRLLDVPLLVPLIWPLVILSARDVATGLWPRARGIGRAAIVGAIVAFDASLVEVIAIRAELWSWSEPGHLGVPVIGILGWGFFAFGADLVLERAEGAVRASVVVLAPAIGHLLIVASWWLALRWILRDDLGIASLAVLASLTVAATAAIVRARRRGDAIPFDVAWPRVFAALLFFVVAITVAARDVSMWAHVALVAVPYVAATRWPRPVGRQPAPSAR